jgi:tetratricopeptide (TPR) repeat protein
VVTGNRSHRFVIASPTHPAVDMTGALNDSEINARDPFQLFCADNAVPFCYVNPQLMPYLTQVTGTGYVIVPGGADIGSMPRDVTRSWLRTQMIASLGQPTMVLGSGATALLVWRIAAPQPVVSTFPAVALVDSGSWDTTAVLPALEATGLPAAYRQSADNVHYPVAPANLPESVRILPREKGGCLGSAGATVGVMAQSESSSLMLDSAGQAQTLPLLATASRLPGWRVYGPLSVGAGLTPLTSAIPNVTLGPCIAWSPLAATVFNAYSSPAFATTMSAQGERITATTTSQVAQPWVELLRYEDPGWRLGTEHPTVLGGGLFNLYHLSAAHQQSTKLTFAFSTINWELLGRGISAVVVLLAVVVAVWDSRRRRFDSAAYAAYRQQAFVVSRLARWLAGVGLGLLVVTSIVVTLEWFGVPSLVPVIAVASDPYNVDVGFGGAAIGVLLLALVVVGVSSLFESRLERVSERTGVPKSAGIAVACVAVLGILLSACGSSPGDIQTLLSQAQAAGALAPTVTGDSLDEARLQRAANDAEACIADYTAVLRALPQLLTAYVGRGQCYLSGGDNGAAAVHDFSAAIALEPAQSDLYLDRAIADRVVGNYAAAIADYTSGAFAPVGGANQQLTAVTGLVALNDISEAMTVYQRALQLDPQSAVLRLAGAAIAVASDDDAGADAAVTSGLKLATNNAQMGQVLAAACHLDVLRQEITLAISTCTQAAQASSPGGSGAYDDLSAAELASGNPSAALAAITASIEAFTANVGPYAQESGVDGFGLANLYIARAWIQVQLQNSPAAIADFKRALAALPEGSPDARARIKADIATATADG